jgi:hypothetical protein
MRLRIVVLTGRRFGIASLYGEMVAIIIEFAISSQEPLKEGGQRGSVLGIAQVILAVGNLRPSIGQSRKLSLL